MMLSGNGNLFEKDKLKINCSQKLNVKNPIKDKHFIDNNLTLKKETHKYCLNCLNKCSHFKLNLTINENKKNIGYQFNTNDIYFFENISSNNLLKLLEEKDEKGININKYNIQNISDNKNKDKNILLQNLFFPIQNNQKVTDEISIWEDLSFSLNSNENSNISCLLIEIDLNNCKEENKYFKEVTKSFLKTEINCILNGIVHEREILQNDILFNIDPKKLTKSIELRIQKYKDDYLKLKKEKRNNFKYRNLFFTKFFKHSNLAFMFSTNNKEDLINIENLQTNYSTIPLKKFNLVKLFIAINIPNSISYKNSLNDEKEITNYSTDQSSKIQPLSVYSDEIQNFEHSNSFHNIDIDDNISIYSMLNSSLINPFYGYETFLMGNNINMFNNMGFNYDFSGNYNMFNTFTNGFYENNNIYNFNNQKKNNNIKIIKNEFNNSIILNPIIIDKKDQNVLNIFHCFKTKTKSCSNFIIFKKIMKTLFTKLQKTIWNLPFEKFPKIFQKLSIFGIKIPTINKYGKLYSTSLTPTLSSLTLYIKHTELYILVYNQLNIKFNQRKLSSINNFENNNESFWNHNEFIELNDNIKLSLFNDYVILEFNEIKPHYMRNTLITQLKIISNSLPKTLNKLIIGNIDFQKSFFSILWSPVNTFLNHTSFLTYYLFTLDLIGILPIKLELFKWLTKIGLEKKDNNLKKENELSDSMSKVETFLCNYSLFNSYDFEFYQKNKIFIKKNIK